MNHQTIEPLRPALEKLADRKREEVERHSRRMHTLQVYEEILPETVRGFDKTGVFEISAGAIMALEEEQVLVRGIMQDVARQQGRPYIRAERGSHHIELKVPYTKRLQPIVAPLLLVAQKFAAANRYSVLHLPHGVWLDEERGTWRFIFVGTAAERVYEQFVERCHTDPVNRIILKL